MSQRQAQESHHGEEEPRVVPKSRHEIPGCFDSQPVLSVAEFKLHSAKSVAYRSKLLKVGVLEAQGDLWQRVRARGTRHLLKCGRQIRAWTKAQGDLWQDPTSEPPANNWPTTTFPYRQTIGRLWKGSLRNVRRKLGLSEQHTMGPNFINEAIWGTFTNACM